MQIDDQKLHDLCCGDPSTVSVFHASQAAFGLGGLAPWWLDPAVLAKAALAPEAAPWHQHWQAVPALPRTPGSCWVAVVKNKGSQSLLREAFVLPLQWRPNLGHSDKLPPSLTQVAQSVLDVFQEKGLLADKAFWGLQLAAVDEIDRLDLSGLQASLTWSSAWAPLAGGLRIASVGGTPDPAVWASGCWQDGMLTRVDGVAAKIRLAQAWGAREIYLPTDGLSEIPKECGLKIGHLHSEQSEPLRILANYLDRLDALPAPSDSAQRRIARYLRFASHSQASAFYVSHLLPDVIDHCRSMWPPGISADATRDLITIASHSAELSEVAAAIFRPRRMLILHTPDSAMVDAARKRRRECGKYCDAVEAAEVRDWPYVEGDIVERCRVWLNGKPDIDHVILDLTPGRKNMSIALTRLAGERVIPVYLTHQYDPLARRSVPLTEQYCVIDRAEVEHVAQIRGITT